MWENFLKVLGFLFLAGLVFWILRLVYDAAGSDMVMTLVIITGVVGLLCYHWGKLFGHGPSLSKGYIDGWFA